MYFTEKSIAELSEEYVRNLRSANADHIKTGGNLASIERCLQKHKILSPRALEIATKTLGNGAKVEKKMSGV